MRHLEKFEHKVFHDIKKWFVEMINICRSLIILCLCFEKFLFSENFKDGIITCLKIVSAFPEIGSKVGEVIDEIRFSQLHSCLSWVMGT